MTLITGANGHLGRRLISKLVAEEVPVRALVRSERAARTLVEHPCAGHFEVCVVDYTDEDGLARAALGCDHVIHLVGILKQTPQARYVDAHENATRALTRACERAGVARIVYLSILGSTPSAANACLASKGRAEQMLADGPVPSTVLRLPMVLGPGDFASKALRGKAQAPLCFLVRGGATLEQPIDADDVLSAVTQAVDPSRNSPTHLDLDLAGPESLPHVDLVRRAAKLYDRMPRVVPIPLAFARLMASAMERFSKNPPITRAMLEVLEHDDRVDPAPACKQLGLELTPLDETLRRCVGPDAEEA